ncbi:MAG: replication-associated recombination protein A [Planctomycetota bacterium]
MTADRTDDRAPLAERMRPRSLAEVVGQEHLLGERGLLPPLLSSGRPPSLILWGPPGCGKTTIARLIATELDRPPVRISAVTSGVREVKEIVARSREERAAGGRATLLFVDEIHRFNKAQQDAFLGPVEDGSIILVGATTENPGFELNSAILSRCRVLVLEPLGEGALAALLERALADAERGIGSAPPPLDAEGKALLVARADGDARALLTDLEWVALGAGRAGLDRVSPAEVTRILSTRPPRHDRAGDQHYDSISALHKSLRGSDVQAGLYWLARMLEGGADPLAIVRRLVRFASEDVGAADPDALRHAVAARDAVHFLGMPEGALALAELVVILATAPKSDRVYRAYSAAVEAVRRTGTLPVPPEVRNAPTGLARALGHGAGYHSPHRDPRGLLVPFLPEELRGERFYEPGELGFEREIAKRITYWEQLRARAREGER